MNYRNNVTELIGNIPLFKVDRMVPDLDIFAKSEFMNPLSIKDRPVLQIFRDASNFI
jgi:cysteine synthase